MSDPRPIIVLDTNAVLDWLVFAEPEMQPVGQAVAAGQLDWIATDAMQTELMLVLARAHIQNWSPDQALVEDTWARHARRLAPPATAPLAPRCSDPDDQMFIDLALAHRARWLVTRDRALLRLRRRLALHGVTVLAPPQWRAD
jgi:uncharacterized protein